MSGLENTIYTEKPKIDNSIFIEAHMCTPRILELSWSNIPTKYFPTKDSVALLEYSDSPTSGFITLKEISRDHPPFYIDDHTITTYYRFPIVYYRFNFPELGVTSRVFSNEKLPNYYGAEIIRRHLIQLREGHAGNLMYLCIKRRTAEKCPNCWDQIRGQRTKTSCPVCLNTGFIGGYFDPIGVYVSLSPESVSVAQPFDGTAITGQLQAWTAGFPRFNLGDALIDANTRNIWHVSQVSLTTHKRVVTKQELMLQRQDDDSHIFDILQRIPKKPKKEDMRHGEIIF